MAASDQTYRNQRRLDLIFGVSSLLMLIAVVLLFAQDYFQPWKTEQRTFRDVDEGITLQAMLSEAHLAWDEVNKAEAAAFEAREILAAVKKKDPQEQAQVDFDKADRKRSGIKAKYDSEVSLLNIAKDHYDAAVLAGDKSEATHYEREIKSREA